MLDNALDYGILEKDFWEMTIAELERQVASKKRVMEIEAKERATFDYIHASLIGKALLTAFGDKVEYPSIHEVYPRIFSKEEVQEHQVSRQDQLSAARFIQFAQSFNQQFNKEVLQD